MKDMKKTMPENVYYKIEQQTKFSQEKRKSLVNWFNKQNILIQVDIFKEQRNQFFKLQSIGKEREILSLSSFYIAIYIFYEKDKIIKQKNKNESIDALSTMSDFSHKKFRKIRIKAKREKLLNYISIIRNMKNESFSFRDISKYLLKNHKFEVSHTYIKKIYEEFEND